MRSFGAQGGARWPEDISLRRTRESEVCQCVRGRAESRRAAFAAAPMRSFGAQGGARWTEDGSLRQTSDGEVQARDGRVAGFEPSRAAPPSLQRRCAASAPEEARAGLKTARSDKRARAK